MVKITAARTLYAHWVAGTNTAYLVLHRRQKPDGTYDGTPDGPLTEIEVFASVTGEMTAASAKTYDGFTAGAVNQVKISAAGNTKVEILYTRNTYSIVFEENGHGIAPAPVAALYEATVSAPEDPETEGYDFGGWFEEAECSTPYVFGTMPLGGKTVYAKWTVRRYTITWNMDGKESTTQAEHGTLPVYNGHVGKQAFIFTGWSPAVKIATGDAYYTAMFEHQSIMPLSSHGPGGPSAQKTAPAATFSKIWHQEPDGSWTVRDRAGETVKSAWLCDDAVAGNGKEVWYLFDAGGKMLSAGLVQDGSGNFYSLETTHQGYYGMLRCRDGIYDCGGQPVYLQFSQRHDGSFGAVINPDGIEKLKAIYGVTKYAIGSENCRYTSQF